MKGALETDILTTISEYTKETDHSDDLDNLLSDTAILWI